MRKELCSMGSFYPRPNNAPPPLRDWSYIAYCLSIQHGLDVLSLEVAKLDCYLSYRGDIV